VKHFFEDCRHALRVYARTPCASLLAVFVLAIGMAFVNAFLSLYVDLVLRPHPGFEESGRIVTIGQNAGTVVFGMPFEIVERLSDEITSIEATAMLTGVETLVGADNEQIPTGMVSRSFFSGIRPRLALGRPFDDEDHDSAAEPVVVLSYPYWQQRYGSDRNVLGSYLRIARDPGSRYQGSPGNGLPQTGSEPEQQSAQFRIVGVMADTFRGLPYNGTTDPLLWVPLERAYPMFVGVAENLPRLTAWTYARRAPGASVPSIVNELRARYEVPDATTFPMRGTRIDAIDGIVADFAVQREAKRQLETFLAGSVLLALVAAANVSLFLLARAPGRRRELGIRMSVGATTSRIARQLVKEAGLLVVVSTVLGLVGSIWLSFYLRGLAFLQDAEWGNASLLDWRVLAFAGVCLMLLTLLVSLAPILGLRRHGLAASSRETRARVTPVQRIAGFLQIAAAGTFSGAAIAFGWYLGLLMFGDPGFEVVDRYFVQSTSQTRAISGDARTIEAARWREAVEAIPGVAAVAYGSPVPGAEPSAFPTRIRNPVDPSQEMEIYIGEIEQEFIDVLDLKLLHGRAPQGGEPRVIVVNQALARMIWGRDDVVGEILAGDPRFGDIQTGEGSEVIGVLEDVSFRHPAAAAVPYAFRAYAGFTSAVIEADLTAAELEQALNRLDPTDLNIAVSRVSPLETMRNELLAPDRARGFLTAVTALLVVLLAAFGFYGTQRYLVAAGRHEHAIRAAVGAGPKALGRLVVGMGLLLGLPGLVAGSLLAFIAVTWLRDGYLGAAVAPGIVMLAVSGGLILVLLAASYGPARDARRTQPALLLRED
jgi:ABC-type antimicrobial peptide transport system permease subunit